MSKILIQCVVVLYQRSWRDSETMQSLAEICLRQDLSRQVALLVYDNSPTPEPLRTEDWPFASVEYRHAAANDGLAIAYNRALSMAAAAKIHWLLLLDQDTALDSALFEAFFQCFASPPPSAICAIVPKLIAGPKVLSPQRVGRFRNVEYAPSFSGIAPTPVTAFNSAACLRVESLRAIGGFPKEYWLDYLDHATFHRLQAAGGRVLILDVEIEHRHSLQNLDTGMSLDRYKNLLAAEWRFVRETGTGGGQLMHRMRLLKRALIQGKKPRLSAYARSTLQAISH